MMETVLASLIPLSLLVACLYIFSEEEPWKVTIVARLEVAAMLQLLRLEVKAKSGDINHLCECSAHSAGSERTARSEEADEQG